MSPEAARIAPCLSLVGPRKVRISREGISLFNAYWPCSKLRSSRAYWVEFDAYGDLVDTDCPEHDDGPAAVALAADCQEWMEENAD